MSMTRTSLAAVGVALLLGACEDEVPRASRPGLGGTSSGASGANAAGSPEASAGTNGVPVAWSSLRDSDFVEGEGNRDPFRNFTIEVKTRAPVVAQRTVLMPNTPLKSMRLIAIITGIDQPRAMLVDERGVGYVTRRGDFVGVADIVQTGGAENLPVALNWRVDRIRANEVVLAREDPSGPNRPPLVQVIPLHRPEDVVDTSITDVKEEG